MLVCLFWTVFIALGFKKADRARRVLLVFYCVATVLYTCHYVYYAGYGTSWIEALYTCCNLSVFPLFYLFVNVYIGKKLSNGAFVLMFSPAVLMTVCHVVCIFLLDDWAEMRPIIQIVVRLLFAVQVVCVSFMGVRKLRVYKHELDDFYSDDRGRVVHPTIVLLYCFCIISVFSMLLNLIGRDFFLNNLIIVLPALVMSIMLYALGYVCMSLPESYLLGMSADAVTI